MDENNQQCLVSDLYENGDFQSYIDKRKGLAFKEDEIMRFVANIVVAVCILDARGKYHGDLKPSKFLLSKMNDGKIYLHYNVFSIAHNQRHLPPLPPPTADPANPALTPPAEPVAQPILENPNPEPSPRELNPELTLSATQFLSAADRPQETKEQKSKKDAWYIGFISYLLCELKLPKQHDIQINNKYRYELSDMIR